MIYGELGRYPLDIRLKVKLICYWYNVIHSKTSKLNNICYNILLQLSNDNIMENAWLKCVKQTLTNCGLIFIWNSQAANIKYDWLKTIVTRTLQDLFITKWYSDMELSTKCILYKDFKPEFGFENYLLHAPYQFTTCITKFRLSNHKLPVERGRYLNIIRSERTCDVCDMNVLGDEYHYIMECRNEEIVKTRKSVIPIYYRTNINVLKFTELIKKLSLSKTYCQKIGKLIKCIMSVVK